MIQEKVAFFNDKGETLHGVIRVPEEEGKFPAVIICHSFKGNKDRELIINLWDAVSMAGFIALRFDFSGHGESSGRFRESTLTQFIKDLSAAFEFVEKLEHADAKKIGLVGHSFGADVSILFAGQNKNVASLASIGGRAHLENFLSSYFTDHQMKEWRRKGFVQFHDFRELNIDILKDVQKYDMIDAVKNLKCPFFIIHAQDDATTPFQEAKELFNHANDPKTLDIIEMADHNFTDAQHREYLFEVVVDFLTKTLK